MISHFVKILDDLKSFNEKTPKIRFDALICLGQFLKYDTKIWELIGPKMSKFWNSRKLRYVKRIFF